MAEGQHGTTHAWTAWTEIYIPGAGWRGFDTTISKLAGSEHVSAAAAPRIQQHYGSIGAGRIASNSAWNGPSPFLASLSNGV